MRVEGDKTARLQHIWQSGEFFGDQRAYARATIQRGNVRLSHTPDYGDFASLVFSYTGGLLPGSTPDHPKGDPLFLPRELPNLKSVKWNRDVDNSIADVTIEVWNTYDDPDTGESIQGYYTWNRGEGPFDAKHAETTYNDQGGIATFGEQVRTVGGWLAQRFTVDEDVPVSRFQWKVPAGGTGSYRLTVYDLGPNFALAARQLSTVDVTLTVGTNVVTLPGQVMLRASNGYQVRLASTGGASFPAVVSGTQGINDRTGNPAHSFSCPGATYPPTLNESRFCFAMLSPPVVTMVGQRNDWFGWLIPDNVIRIFEGYGVDWDTVPEGDQNLLMTGTFLIDDVTMTGPVITIKARDFARVLGEQTFYPPIVPRKSNIPGIQYPLYFDHYTNVPNAPSAQPKIAMWYFSSSNAPYVGNGYIHGHRGVDAFDGSSGSYWLSVGNSQPNAGYSYEWVEGACNPSAVAEVRVKPFGSNMRAWVSVFANGGWVDRAGVIPYDPHNPVSAPNGANIPAVAAFNCAGDGQQVTCQFPEIAGATRVRVSFTNLANSGIGPYVYRAGVRDLECHAAAKSIGTHRVGNYGDYSDIIKLILAWGGFHWPETMPFVGLSIGFAIPIGANPARDPFLGNGRIWGDIESTGTWGSIPLPFTDFDKKFLMDGIQEIKDITQFIFGVDEAGGAFWRAPNIWDLGNFINGRRVKQFTRILDTQVLLEISAKLSGRNWRERIYVADPSGMVAAGARGYSLNPIGLRRVGGWVDEHFAENPAGNAAGQADALRMAQLIAVRQMMSTREDTFTIPGNPCIEIDDQIELVDTNVGESFVHYVKGLSSSLDLTTGEYTMTCTSQWLGVSPGNNWIIDKYGNLGGDVQALLDRADYARKDGVYNAFPPVVLS